MPSNRGHFFALIYFNLSFNQNITEGRVLLHCVRIDKFNPDNIR